jgi:O-antigen/teichoic acid export membrane protein
MGATGRDELDKGPADGDVSSDGRDETEAERADRNFTDLLQELRVAQTGVQILFAFLLTLPFTQRFEKLGDDDRSVYLGTLLATAVATACLIAPVSQHRILFRRHRKPEIVDTANKLAQAGLGFLLIAVAGAVYLIFDVVIGAWVAGVIAGLLAVMFVLIWYVQPLVELRRRRP